LAGPRGSQFQFRPVDRLLSPPIQQRPPQQLFAAAHGPTTTCSAGVDSQPAAAAERHLAEVAVAELRAAAVEKACPGSRRCGAIGDRPGFDQPAAGPGLAHPAPSPHPLMHAPTCRTQASCTTGEPKVALTHPRTHWRAEGRYHPRTHWRAEGRTHAPMHPPTGEPKAARTHPRTHWRAEGRTHAPTRPRACPPLCCSWCGGLPKCCRTTMVCRCSTLFTAAEQPWFAANRPRFTAA
jgi:hypothetical protein